MGNEIEQKGFENKIELISQKITEAFSHAKYFKIKKFHKWNSVYDHIIKSLGKLGFKLWSFLLLNKGRTFLLPQWHKC